MSHPPWVDGLWLVASLGLLAFFQRRFHASVQAILLLGTWSARPAFALYALLLLPGVVAHEVSHILAAFALGVRVREVSLRPRRNRSGRIRLGFVSTDRADPIRSALIGLAPTLSGAGLLLLGYQLSGASQVAPLLWPPAQAAGVLGASVEVNRLPEAAGWIYLALAVGNNMLPSPADRSAWFAAGLLLAIVIGGLFFAGAAQVLAGWALPTLRIGARALAASFTLVGLLDFALLALLWPLRKILETLTRRQVVQRA